MSMKESYVGLTISAVNNSGSTRIANTIVPVSEHSSGYFQITEMNGDEVYVGVIFDDVSNGDWISVTMSGIVEVLSGGAINIGNTVKQSTAGKAVASSTNTIGVALSAATASDQIIKVKLF